MSNISTERRFLSLALLLIAAVLVLYHQVHNFQFLEDYDDGAYVTNNFHIKYGIDGEMVKWAFTAYYSQNWHPVTWLSHAMDCQLYYLNSGKHHETSAVLHALNAFLLFWLLWKASGYPGRSLMVGALFALHPINVESVAWISERKNILSALFFLLALGAYGWYATKPQLKRYLLVFLLFAIALMAKPQVITFPCILLLWDYWPLGRMFSNGDALHGVAVEHTIPAKGLAFLILEKVPLFFLSAASAIVTLQAQNTGDAMRGAMSAHTLSFRLNNVVVSYARYVAKAFWPLHLSPFYTFPAGGWQAWQVVISAILAVAVTSAVFIERGKARYLLVGWLWFLGSLVPMIGILQVGSQAMADRYAYLPFVGLFIMVCWGIPDIYLRMIKVKSQAKVINSTPLADGQVLHSEERTSFWLPAASLIVLLLLAIISYRQIGYWKDSLTLWSHAVQIDDNNDVAHDKLGSVLVMNGHEEEAVAQFRSAVQVNPSDPQLNFHMGFSEQRHGNLPAAIEYYKKVLSLTKDDVLLYAGLRNDALTNMSVAYRGLGDFAHAAECFDEAARLRQQYRK